MVKWDCPDLNRSQWLPKPQVYQANPQSLHIGNAVTLIIISFYFSLIFGLKHMLLSEHVNVQMEALL